MPLTLLWKKSRHALLTDFRDKIFQSTLSEINRSSFLDHHFYRQMYNYYIRCDLCEKRENISLLNINGKKTKTPGRLKVHAHSWTTVQIRSILLKHTGTIGVFTCTLVPTFIHTMFTYRLICIPEYIRVCMHACLQR